MERRTHPALRLHPDATAVAFDNLLADRQADAGARILVAGVQPLENLEVWLPELRLDADSIGADREVPLGPVLSGPDVDARGRLATILDGVADQVLEYLDQLAFVHQDGGQGVVSHRGAALFDGEPQISDGP